MRAHTGVANDRIRVLGARSTRYGMKFTKWQVNGIKRREGDAMFMLIHGVGSCGNLQF